MSGDRPLKFRAHYEGTVTVTPGVPAPHTHAATDVNSAVLSPARLASGTPAAGKYPDGTGVWTTLPAGGTGDVTGPGSAVSGNLASFSGTSGKVIQDSGIAASAVATLASVAAAYQPLDSDLTAIAALSTTSYGRNLLTLANQAALTAANANATETLPGIIEIATSGEVAAGTDDVRAVTPLKLLGSFGTFATYLGGVYQPLDSDLTTISGLTPTTGNVIQSVGGTWASRTMAQLKVSLAVVVADISDFASAVASAITAERSATATLSGKTLTAPVISSIVNTGTLTLPTSTDTLVGRATTDTLTNKTLTSPTLTTPVLGTPASGNLANCTFPTLNQNTTGSAASAATLTTGRTLAITGDLAWTSPSFNGSGNVTAAGTLATVNSNVGSFGSASSVATFTVNAKGLTTAAGSTPIAIDASQVTSGAFALARLGPGAAAGKYLDGGTSSWLPLPAYGGVLPGVPYTYKGSAATTPTTGQLYYDPGPPCFRFYEVDANGNDISPAYGSGLAPAFATVVDSSGHIAIDAVAGAPTNPSVGVWEFTLNVGVTMTAFTTNQPIYLRF